MNYTTLIVKLLGTPKKSSIENEIPVTEFIGKFYQYRKNKYIGGEWSDRKDYGGI